MPVILLRHTRPAVAAGLCYGSSELGLAESFATDAAAVVAALPPVSRVVTSPLHRCRTLAEHIAAERALGVVVDPRLREMDFGTWEGRRWDALPRAELDAWAADFLHARPHGGENVAMLAARVRAALAEAPAQVPPPLWVTHAGVVRAACAATGREAGWETRLGFGRWLNLAAAGDIPAKTSPS